VHTDELEKLYGNIESPQGQLFDLIRKGLPSDELISKDGIYLLKTFIAFQFWRMPILDPIVEEYIKDLDLTKFGDKLTLNGVNIGDCDEIKVLIETYKGFRLYFRNFILPLLTFDLRVHEGDFQSWKVHQISPDENGWNNFLTGDNPLLFEDLIKMFGFKSKFIMPLSNNLLITYSPSVNLDMDLSPLFTTYLAMAVYSQCERYVVGTNREYMAQIKAFMTSSAAPADLRAEVFKYI